MRFDPGKAWPHPVLRPPSCGDDYPDAEFQVEVEIRRTQTSTAVEVEADFVLSDPDLLSLVRHSKARYSLLIRAPKTHYRALLQSTDTTIASSIGAGVLSGRVEFQPFLTCTETLDDFRAEGWHRDYGDRTFRLSPGTVLAEDEPKVYWIDPADEAPLGAIFEHRSRPDLPDGRWHCELDDDRIGIAMSLDDSLRYSLARNRVNRTQEGQYLMNGVYLPALVYVLSVADRDQDEYSDRRWFSALDQRLDALGCKSLGTRNADRLADAQKVLESPFGKMPIIAHAEDES